MKIMICGGLGLRLLSKSLSECCSVGESCIHTHTKKERERVGVNAVARR